MSGPIGLRPMTLLINLDGKQERREASEKALSDAGIAFERVSAVDGRQRPPTFSPDYSDSLAKQWIGRSLSGPEVGCFLSHRACLDLFLASEKPFCFVFEDDALPAAGALETMEALMIWVSQNPHLGLSIVNLSMPFRRFHLPVRTGHRTLDERLFSRAPYFPATTSALFWTREGAKAFLKFTQGRIEAPVDLAIQWWCAAENRGIAFREPPVAVANGDSDILDAGVRAKASRNWKHVITRTWFRVKRFQQAFVHWILRSNP